MPHKPTFGEGRCRINAPLDETDAACLPDEHCIRRGKIPTLKLGAT